MSHRASRRKLTIVSVGVAGALGAAGLTLLPSMASAAPCSDVEVVFARGSGEAPGLGIVGAPLVRDIKSGLPGKSVTSHAVDYAANFSQTSAGPGASAMTDHVRSTAANCPDTSFVLGGYSQGASVTDIALGIRTTLGTGRTIPTDLAPRVKAVVVFGNPLQLSGRTINTASGLYGAKAKEFCNTGDPVCGNGRSTAAHLRYHVNGSVQTGARFAVDRIEAG
ncbi:cutinase family protein [Streptomyces sp. NPDC057620]|uniref:Cutinase family protein n=1 Tax=Streptomyces liliiviolaceus TaxID=2823109 RepID=A0A940XXH4_9ACTN|nr:cutinase family protein [Streptomyces liliiviolaceus]MBQ0852587.1 cutinase family protein [Streptomyces liliiviolaceus]